MGRGRGIGDFLGTPGGWPPADRASLAAMSWSVTFSYFCGLSSGAWSSMFPIEWLRLLREWEYDRCTVSYAEITKLCWKFQAFTQYSIFMGCVLNSDFWRPVRLLNIIHIPQL